MIKLLVNDKPVETAYSNLQQLLELEQSLTTEQSTKYAIAINENFIPKSDYQKTSLKDGDKIELLMPMQGG